MSVYSTGDGVFNRNTSTYYNDGDSARTGYIGDSQVSQMEVRVSGAGTATFYWKVSSEQNCDWVEFYIDGVRQDRISGTVDWQQKSYPITGSGTHSLLWQYVKDTSGTSGSDAGWVDYLQWTGAASASASADWEEIEYTYDPSGRRIAKDVDGEVTKYLVACPEPVERDGDHCIAEYACPEPAEWDANDVLLRKFIYGPGVDQPICMIDVADANLALSLSNGAAYYYHYDALGSVVALSDSAGDTVQVYEYDVYGQVAASDPNHPNPFLFTGRRYDADTGLYYYRARYYNPSIGRFLQTDPIGYGDGMNWYAYCRNNALNCVDPSGTHAGAGLWWGAVDLPSPDLTDVINAIGVAAGAISDAGGPYAPGASKIGGGVLAIVAAVQTAVRGGNQANATIAFNTGVCLIATGIIQIGDAATGQNTFEGAPGTAVALTAWALGMDDAAQFFEGVESVLGGGVAEFDGVSPSVNTLKRVVEMLDSASGIIQESPGGFDNSENNGGTGASAGGSAGIHDSNDCNDCSCDGLDRCSVCGNGPDVCGYRWNFGYCTVLQKWP